MHDFLLCDHGSSDGAADVAGGSGYSRRLLRALFLVCFVPFFQGRLEVFIS